MFVSRLGSIEHTLDRYMSELSGVAIADLRGLNDGVAWIYVILAFVALAFLVVPLVSMGMSAARLGAQGRSRRLASLRLVGVTSGQVYVMSVLETLLQYAIGFVIGFAVYGASLPAWHQLSFQTQQIAMGEMLLPWWGILAVAAVLGILAAISTIAGLVRVSISPLGVARRDSAHSVRVWRVIALAIVAAGVIAAFQFRLQIEAFFGIDPSLTATIVSIAMGMMILMAFTAVAGPFFVQTTARFGLPSGSASTLVAARRIVDDPRAAWRNVGSAALMCFVASATTTLATTTITITSVDSTGYSGKVDPGALSSEIITGDITKGVMIAFAFTIVLAAVGTLIQQASDVFDRANETHTLAQIGAPAGTFSRTRFKQVMYPFVTTLVACVVVGGLPGVVTAAVQAGGVIRDNMLLLSAMVGVSVVIMLGSVALTIPIERGVVTSMQRKND